MKLEFTKKALEDLEYWASADRKRLMKVRDLLRETVATPFTGTGKPEPLRHELSGCWSRRINTKDRIIYQVDEQAGIVTIISAKGHYR